MKKSATIKDVAQLSGFGISVVSYVLNNTPNISVKPETRQRILEAAEQLNYTPNAIARNMRKGVPCTIGILSSWDIADMTEILNDVLSFANDRMYSVVLCPYSKERCFDYIKLYQSKIISGLILIPPSSDSDWFRLGEHIKAITSNAVPAVLISGRKPEYDINRIVFDYKNSAIAAVDYLIGLNHRKIAFIGPEDGNLKAQYIHSRIEAYKEYMKKMGLAYRVIPFSMLDSVFEKTTAQAAPTALIAAKSQTAHIILQKAYDRHLRIPDCFSVISCNYSNKNFYSEPQLTSVAVDTGNPGMLAAQILFSHIENPDLQSEQIILPCEIREGKSCKAL